VPPRLAAWCRRALALAGRLLQGVAIVAIGVVIGKVCQYAAVDALGARLGFAGTSLVGLTPFVAVLFVMQARYPRLFGRRAIVR
jgi:hypothetical protein